MARIRPDEPCPCGSGKPFGDCHGPKVTTRVAPPITSHIRLKVIPEPAPNTKAVFEKLGSGTVLINGFDTGISYDCGTCGEPLMRGVQKGQVRGIVLRCGACCSYNDTE